MKKLIIASIFVSGLTAAHAEGYAGAVASLTSIGGGCDSRLAECDKKGFGVKVYFGSKLTGARQLDLGIGKIDAVEAGFVNFGKIQSQGMIQLPDVTDALGINLVPSRATTSATANALVVAAVAHVPVADDFTGVVKLGGAYVSSTVRYFIEGASDSSKTATKLQPYIGLGFEMALASNIKLVGSYDWTRFSVEGQKGSLGAFGMGAQFGF